MVIIFVCSRINDILYTTKQPQQLPSHYLEKGAEEIFGKRQGNYPNMHLPSKYLVFVLSVNGPLLWYTGGLSRE